MKFAFMSLTVRYWDVYEITGDVYEICIKCRIKCMINCDCEMYHVMFDMQERYGEDQLLESGYIYHVK